MFACGLCLTVGFCAFLYLPTWVPADVSWLWVPRSVDVSVQCCVSAVPSGTFASVTICASLYLFVLWSFAVCGVLCPGESCPESLMFSVAS